MGSTRIFDFGQSRGRGLVATKFLTSDETVFCEKPLLCCQFSWNKKYGYSACDFCLRPLETAEQNARRLANNPTLTLPYNSPCASSPSGQTEITIFLCPDCGTKFCSQECHDMASRLYHSLLCPKEAADNESEPLNNLDAIWRETHYPPETSTVMLIIRIVAVQLTAHLLGNDDAKEIISALSGFNCNVTESSGLDASPDNSLAHKLLGERFSEHLSRLHAAFTKATTHLIEKLTPGGDPWQVIRTANLANMMTTDGFCSALSLLGRNGQGIATSSLSSWAKAAETMAKKLESTGDASMNGACANGASNGNLFASDGLQLFLDELYGAVDEHVGPFLDNEGVGLYRHQSLINHSCSPNCNIQFSGDSSALNVVAKRPVSPNEELTISYLDECMLARSRHSRRRYLAENYLFWCACDRCEQEKASGAASETSEDEDDEEEDDDDDDDEEDEAAKAEPMLG